MRNKIPWGIYLPSGPSWELFPGSLALARKAEALDNRCPTPEEWSASREERARKVQEWLRELWAESDAPPPCPHLEATKLLRYLLRDLPFADSVSVVPRRKWRYMARRSRRAMRRRAMWGVATYGDVTGRYVEFDDSNLGPFEYMHARGLDSN